MRTPSFISLRTVNTLNFLILFLLIVCIILLGSVPPTSRDALIHHLQIPKLYLLHGGIYEIPDLNFSYYPMNLDLLYMGALYLGNDILPKYIHMTFGLATALLIYNYLKNHISTTYAYLGAIFFLSIPIIVKLSITVYVDLGLVFFSTSSMMLLFQWIDNNYKKRYILLAGLCCGLAIGTKYNGLIVLFLLTLLVPILFIRSSLQSKGATTLALQACSLFFLCALLTVSPWFIRNTLWTGNPIFPLYDSFFNPALETVTSSPVNSHQIRGVFATRYALYGETLVQLLLLPVRIFFEGLDNDPRYFDGRLNPFLLFLPVVAFLHHSTEKNGEQLKKVILLVFCLLYFLFAFNTTELRIRYLAPMIPFLVILALYGLRNIETYTKQHLRNHKIIATVWLLPVCLMLALNANYIFQQFKYITPISYITGRISRDEYLTKHLPEYKIMQYANTHLPESAKILCVFMGWRGYYLDRAHVFDHQNNSKLFISWLKQSDITANTIMQRLLKHDISHLMIRKDLFYQWVQHANLSKQTIDTILVQNYFSPIFEHQGYILYQVNYLND